MTSNSSLPAQVSSRLESLRGVAAMVVALYHCLTVFNTSHSNSPLVWPAMVIFNGKAAVSLFFVLSGLVLGLSLRRSSQKMIPNCFGYVVRRFFRIYPAFVVATALVVPVIVAFHRLPPSDSVWANHYFPDSLTGRGIVLNLLFCSHSLNPVTWTLRAEMICSCLLPVFYYASRVWLAIPWLLLPVLMGVSRYYTDVVSVGVTQAFLIGYLIPQTTGWWRRFEGRRVFVLPCLIVGLALMILPRISGAYQSTITLVESAGAALVIVSVLGAGRLAVFALLDWRPVQMAGRTSYSYYLIQPLVLMPVVGLLLTRIQLLAHDRFPLVCSFFLWILTSVIAFPLAWLSYRWIESPLISFSKSIVGKRKSLSPVTPSAGCVIAE